MNIKKIIKLFRSGNVCVFGLRGRGKDVLMSNVVVRRKLPYVSNVDYGGDFRKFVPKDFDLGGNTYRNFLNDDIRYYEFPFADGTDIFVSDAGVYFPSQYSGQLDHQYPYFAGFAALTRQLGLCNFHYNAQNLERVWNKFREQSDIYIMCNHCRFPFFCTGIPWLRDVVIQKITIYEKYQSAVDRVPPYRPPKVRLNTDRKFALQQEKQRYRISYGDIRSHILIYRNKSSFDTRIFRTMLLEGKHAVPSTSETPELPIDERTQ